MSIPYFLILYHKKEFCHIDWSKNSVEIINFVKGLSPKPGAYCFYDNKVFKIWGLQEFGVYGNEEPGQIVSVNKNGVAVKTFDGALLVTKPFATSAPTWW